MSSKAMECSSLPCCTSYNKPFKYDVFLSFRGEDTRKNFVDHLFTCLSQKGIITFKDDQELELGKPISQGLVNAMQESRILVVIFSRNYASSTWCLDELVTIWECHQRRTQTVLPVFYKVAPSEVRKQEGRIGEAFSRYEELFKENNWRVKRWRNAMTNAANLSGWDLQDRHESKFIQDISEDIICKLRKSRPELLSMAKNLVGIDSRVTEIVHKYLGMGILDDTRIIGISGMGGIGKTTLARVVYEKMSFLFEGSSFLANVRETHKKHGIAYLQEQLLHEILMERKAKVWDAEGGANEIRSRLCHKKVILIIDDVDQLEQLKFLIGGRDWFGSGSRIIITTRDEHLLSCYGVDDIYRVHGLTQDEALELFYLKAFRNDHPIKGFKGLSHLFVNYANGLPLGIDVMGSFLFGRSKDEWESALCRLKKVPHRGILDKLQISFDGLEDVEKEMFLHIACFLKGEEVHYAKRVLESCGLYPDIGMRVLVDKSLVSMKNGKVWMHDLLQEMGQEIVKRESYEEPGRRSRLWHYDDLYHVLENNTGTKNVKGVFLYSRGVDDHKQLNAKAFKRLTKLRLLKLQYFHILGDIEYLSNELKYLEWHGYPFKHLPSTFHPLKLVELHMHHSGLINLMSIKRPMEMLKVIDIRHSKNLRRIFDFKLVPNLEELNLEGCIRLKKIHPSIEVLQRLAFLNLKGCKKLSNLPIGICNLKCLRFLILDGCSNLGKLPNRMDDLVFLEKFHMQYGSIQSLCIENKPLELLKVIDLSYSTNLVKTPNFRNIPNIEELILQHCVRLIEVHQSIGVLKRLSALNLKGCESLPTLPNEVFCLQSLRVLNLHGCSNLAKLPIEMLDNLVSLEELDVGGIIKDCLISVALKFPSLQTFHRLRILDLSGCNMVDGTLPEDLGCLPLLTELNLSENHFTRIPKSITGLSRLIYLWLTNCNRLLSVPDISPGTMYLSLDGCKSLKVFPNPFVHQSATFLNFTFFNCFKLTRIQDAFEWGFYASHTCFSLCLPGSEIPRWFNYQGTSSPLRVPLPPNWCDKWVGFFVCTVIGAEHNSETGPFMFDCDISVWFTSEEKEMGWGIRRQLSKVDICMASDHFWFKFMKPDSSISVDTWNLCSHIKVSVTGFGKGAKVKCCGLRIIYQEDIEELKRSNLISKHRALPYFDDLNRDKRSFADKLGSSMELQVSKRMRVIGESQA